MTEGALGEVRFGWCMTLDDAVTVTVYINLDELTEPGIDQRVQLLAQMALHRAASCDLLDPGELPKELG